MINKTATIKKKNNTKKNVVAPVMSCIPHTMIRSKIIISKYNNPTIFITNIPDSSVAGPVSTHGKMAGQRYVAAWRRRPIYPRLGPTVEPIGPPVLVALPAP